MDPSPFPLFAISAAASSTVSSNSTITAAHESSPNAAPLSTHTTRPIGTLPLYEFLLVSLLLVCLVANSAVGICIAGGWWARPRPVSNSQELQYSIHFTRPTSRSKQEYPAASLTPSGSSPRPRTNVLRTLSDISTAAQTPLERRDTTVAEFLGEEGRPLDEMSDMAFDGLGGQGSQEYGRESVDLSAMKFEEYTDGSWDGIEGSIKERQMSLGSVQDAEFSLHRDSDWSLREGGQRQDQGRHN